LNAYRTVIAVAGITATASYFLLDLQAYMTLAALKGNINLLQNYYAANKPLFLAGFMAVYFFQTALCLPGAAVMSLAAGATFGTATGLLCVLAAAVCGAAAAFLSARYLLSEYFTKKFDRRLNGINRELAERGFHYLLFLRLVPLFPFFLINIAAGLTGIRLSTFVWTTLLGIIPGAFVYVNAGASLAAIDSLSGVATPNVLGSLTLLGIMALLPVFLNRGFRRNIR